MPEEQFFDIGVNLTHPSFVKNLDKVIEEAIEAGVTRMCCLLYTSPSPRDRTRSRMPSSA